MLRSIELLCKFQGLLYVPSYGDKSDIITYLIKKKSQRKTLNLCDRYKGFSEESNRLTKQQKNKIKRVIHHNMTTLNRSRNNFLSPDTQLKTSRTRSSSRRDPSPPRALKAPNLQANSPASKSSQVRQDLSEDEELTVYGSSKKVKRETNPLSLGTASSSKESNSEDNHHLKGVSLRSSARTSPFKSFEAHQAMVSTNEKLDSSPRKGHKLNATESPAKGKLNMRELNEEKNEELTVQKTIIKSNLVSPTHSMNGFSLMSKKDSDLLEKTKAFKGSGPSSRAEVRKQGFLSSNRHAPMLEFLGQAESFARQLRLEKPQGLKTPLKTGPKTPKKPVEITESVASTKSKDQEMIVLDEEPRALDTPSRRSSLDALEIPEVVSLEELSVQEEPEMVIDPIDPRIIVSISSLTKGFFTKDELRNRVGLREDIKRINQLNLKRIFKGYQVKKAKVKGVGKQEVLFPSNVKFEEVKIGKQYQAEIPELGDKKKPRIVKSMWNPERVSRSELERYFKALDDETPFGITNEVAKINLLKEYGLDIDKTLDYVISNKLVYRIFFRSERKRGQKVNQ